MATHPRKHSAVIETTNFLVRAAVTLEVVQVWVQAGWLLPEPDGENWCFREIDIARARLISDLQQDFGVNEEAVPIILDLIDQTCGLRRAFRHVSLALDAQPSTVRRQVASRVEELERVGDDEPLAARARLSS